MVAVRSRCGRDVVAMWWCYWSDAPCIRHAPYCDVQDANEMRTVENAKRNERHTGQIRDDSTPEFASFVPQKFPIIKIRAYCSSRQIVAANQPLSSHSRATIRHGIRKVGC